MIHRQIARLAAFSLVAALALGPALADGTDWHTRNGYVLFRAGSESSVMAGTLEEWRRAKKLRTGREAMLYARRGATVYTVRDAATLQRAEAIFAPQRALGDRQAVLGARQETLGDRQEKLGSEQERIGHRLDGASNSAADALNRRQAALGVEQSALGRQQETLGAEQEKLGREEERLAREADVALAALIDDAIRRGVATRIK